MRLGVLGLALIGAIVTFVLKAFGWKGAPLAAISAILVIISYCGEVFGEVFSLFESLPESDGAPQASEYLMKILGIGYLSGICSDVCRELGEPTIASVVTTVARLEALLVILPMVTEIINLGLELVK